MWCYTLFPYVGSSMGPSAFNEHLQLLMPQPVTSWIIAGANGQWGGRSITILGHCKVPPRFPPYPWRIWSLLKLGKDLREFVETRQIRDILQTQAHFFNTGMWIAVKTLELHVIFEEETWLIFSRFLPRALYSLSQGSSKFWFCLWKPSYLQLQVELRSSFKRSCWKRPCEPKRKK